MLSVRLDSPVPLVEQIVAGLRLAIASGELAPGDPLPTVRQVAADLGLNMNTVARAYRALEAEGLVTTVRGRGTAVASARARSRASDPSVRSELVRRARELAADARLAGLDRDATRSMLESGLDGVWRTE